jgi:hypothetical protein
MSASGPKATYAPQKAMSASVSALRPKMDVCGAISDVGFGPIADMRKREQEDRLATISPELSFSLAQISRIQSRIASRGNRTPSGSQASESVALTEGNALAKLRCVSITTAHNIVRYCSAFFGKFVLVLFEAFERVVSKH